MPNRNTTGQRGERGIPGPPGPRGKQGPTGATGKTGVGARARAFSPADRREILAVVHGQMSEVSRELAAQMKRMKSLHLELDELRANVQRLMDSSD